MIFRLKRIDRESDCQRAYVIVESVTLFGERCLILSWGRIGGHTQTRTETFDSQADLEKRRQELVQRRLRHGYSVQRSALEPEGEL